QGNFSIKVIPEIQDRSVLQLRWKLHGLEEDDIDGFMRCKCGLPLVAHIGRVQSRARSNQYQTLAGIQPFSQSLLPGCPRYKLDHIKPCAHATRIEFMRQGFGKIELCSGITDEDFFLIIKDRARFFQLKSRLFELEGHLFKTSWGELFTAAQVPSSQISLNVSIGVPGLTSILKFLANFIGSGTAHVGEVGNVG